MLISSLRQYNNYCTSANFSYKQTENQKINFIKCFYMVLTRFILLSNFFVFKICLFEKSKVGSYITELYFSFYETAIDLLKAIQTYSG